MEPYTIETLPEDSVMEMLFRVTGYRYSFAVASSRCWDREENVQHDNGIGFFQLMPDEEDDGFFDHYCSRQPYNQFYRSREDCVLSFLWWWSNWVCPRKILEEEANKKD